jgi:hypothetical protein
VDRVLSHSMSLLTDHALVVGLGTGRSGTGSLAALLDAQRDAVCFHEMNPACARFFGTPHPILRSIDEFTRILEGGDPSRLTVDLSRVGGSRTYDRLCKLASVRLIGDVASYYLTYVRAIAEQYPSVQFLCTRRDIDQTVTSFMFKTRIPRRWTGYLADRLSAFVRRAPFHEAENPWVQHSGDRWRHSPLWDKLFPKFETSSRKEAIRSYCEYYYEEAERLSSDLGGRFRFVELTRLNEPGYQSDVLSFAGVPVNEQVLREVHVYHV